MNFLEILDNASFASASSSATLTGQIPGEWTQGRTAYGGLSAALCLAAAERLAEDRPLRSAMIGFVGPSAGAVTVDARLVRAGRNASSIRTQLVSDRGPGTTALFTFSAGRDSVLAQGGPAAPATPPTTDTQTLPPREGAPAFTRQLEFVWACDAVPFSASAEPYILSWVRHRDPASRDHPLSLMCLADALPPASATMLAGFAPLSSMNWMIDFFDDRPLTEDGWWLLEARSDFASRGHSSQDMTIWNTSGQCVAKGRQMVAVFG